MVDLLVISHACFMGINRNVYRLFKSDGWQVELVVPKYLQFPSGQREAEPAREDDPPIHYLTLNGVNPRTYEYDGLMDLLDRVKPGLILLDNDPVSRLALQVGKWTKDHGAKLFCISCENLPLGLRATLRRRGWKSAPAALIKRLLLYRTKKVVDGVFTINTDGKQIFTDEGYRYVERIPLGFDPSVFYVDGDVRAALREKRGLKHPVIAYFGRLTREKGVHILISALKDLQQYNWQLMMDDFDEYASGYNKEVYDMMKQAGILERVVFISPNHFEIAAYMNAADIVVVPSIAAPHWKEQYGRVAAEAMACGRLVIASDSGSLPELLNNHGLLFPEGDVAGLRKLIERLLTGNFSEITVPSGQEAAVYADLSLSINRQKEIMTASFELLK